MKKIALALLISLACLSQAFAVNYNFPVQDGFVTDEAEIINDNTETALENKLIALSSEKGIQIAVVTVKSLDDNPIDDYTLNLGRTWGVGLKDVDSGVVFLIAPNEHKMRIETGYGIEGSLTDAESSWIIADVKTFFKNNDFEGGIETGVNEIITATQSENFASGKQITENGLYYCFPLSDF